MSLDQNLFTLNVTVSSEGPDVIDLVDPAGTVHYRKRKVQSETYTIELYDPLSTSLLATATAPLATSKQKTIQLYNPDAVVELKYTGTLSFKWGFKWEDHEFEWRREECYILRKPDPAVLVAVTKEPSGRLKTSSVQILDYNINRFDIDDRKGLEILILTALLTFQDTNDAYHSPRPEDVSNAPGSTSTSNPLSSLLSIGTRREASSSPSGTPTPVPPAIPPRPPPRTGIERVAEMHMLRTLQGEGEANELEVSEEGAVEDYAQFAQRLLQDEAMLFITVRSASATEVPKVLRVVEETKRLRYKSGLQEELHQYVSYDTSNKTKGPRRINLNDPDPKGKSRGKDGYTPPESLVIHLSKIDMPELRPRAEVKDPGPELGWIPDAATADLNPAATRKGKHKEDAKAQKRAEREHKKAEKEQNLGLKKQHASTRPAPNRSTKPASAYHAPPHVPYPYQPSPSQLNNPGIYTAPPFPSPQAPGTAPNAPRWNGPAGPPPNIHSSTILSPWLRR
ncbi:uncharacterized protein C8Q71DRAFT_788121 [Rhodofomes roseus]|uniref:Uncharacterized protein n=1 Tax=Rhodofomes roseus TaxID=34475 RepID=A0ABQ8K184_9APHY|nr:uncharacterized protein C8Q71DRAFT_788121 [Rhodofomes roseus]KAH9829983.1 hypothetical protein C8Q71DRAFT_788121 [Rhodofomes roseus]